MVEGEASSVTSSGNDIYIGGSDESGTIRKAVYWKNGTKVVLSTGVNHVNVNSIKVYGNDVYCAGNEGIANENVPMFWKNNVATVLSSTGSTFTTDIYVR